jgi:hypothetical protein
MNESVRFVRIPQQSGIPAVFFGQIEQVLPLFFSFAARKKH